MKLVKSLLLGSAAAIAAVAVAQAADLPSKKAVAVNYVKICDPYGSGFFYIPGTETCVRLGGYVRAEYQYTPGPKVYQLGIAPAVPTLAAPGIFIQPAEALSTTGYEVRGRIDVDARTPTDLGTARTFIRLRGANTSGIRNTTIVNNGYYVLSDTSSTALTVESALVQWAGFTFGVAPENYAMMPSFMYHSNPWTGFPNGMKQIAYTATFGGGFSATIALEDSKDMNDNQIAIDRTSTAAVLVGNVRLDQAWGFAGLHGMIGNNSIYTNSTVNTSATNAFGVLTAPVAPTAAPAIPPIIGPIVGQQDYLGWGVGSTVSFRLPMLAAGDQVWFTANYMHGMLGALVSTGGLSNVSSTASDRRLLGGIVRVDTNIAPVNALSGGKGLLLSADTITGWNVAMAMTHFWAPQWRSNFTTGYIEINPPNVQSTNVGLQWGKGQLFEIAGSLIYSPVRDLDIGLEVQYANLKNNLQNVSVAPSNWLAAGRPGLNEDNWSTKLRVERTF